MNKHLKHVPNVLSGLRFIAAPVTAALLVYYQYTAALAIFAFAGISDLLDGYLAKRHGYTSRFGRYLDPAADKALMFACFVVLAIQHIVPLWLAGVVIGRDALMILAIVVARLADAPLTLAPLQIGKLTTVVQVVFIASQLAALAFAVDLGDALRWAGFVMAIVTVASAWVYGALWLRAMQHTKGRARAKGA